MRISSNCLQTIQAFLKISGLFANLPDYLETGRGITKTKGFSCNVFLENPWNNLDFVRQSLKKKAAWKCNCFSLNWPTGSIQS